MRESWILKKQQFVVLYRVFLMRVIDLELLAADADAANLVTQFLTVFIYFSSICAIPALMINVNMPAVTARIPEHFFIAATMVVAGVVSVLSWDSVFPDRQDVLILAPLPLTPSTLFVAKIAALISAPALAIVSLNIFTGLTWPIVFMRHNVGALSAMRSWPAYWATMLAAGAFIFCVLLGVQGALANLLPRQIYLRISAFFQAASLCILLSQYFLEPSLESPKALLAAENQTLLHWLPSYWFLGLFQQLNGSITPELDPLAKRAWISLAFAISIATATILLSFFRMLPKIIEQPDLQAGRPAPYLSSGFGFSVRSAIMLFSLRSLSRSRQHRVLLGLYLGIGLAVVIAYLKTPLAAEIDPVTGIGIDYLSATTLMLILAAVAIRAVSAIPISLQANWIFRITQSQPPIRFQSAVRSTWLIMALVPMCLLTAIGFHFFNWRPVAGHIALLLLFGVILIELCLLRFQKIPFACSYLPGKINLLLAFGVVLLLLLWLLHETAKFESRLLGHLFSFALSVVLFAIAAVMMYWLNRIRAGAEPELTFEEEEAAPLMSLKLS